MTDMRIVQKGERQCYRNRKIMIGQNRMAVIMNVFLPVAMCV